MTFEGGFVLPCTYIPQPNRAVLSSTGDSFSIGRKRHSSDPVPMPREGGFLLGDAGIP